jgi:hypothetical protein
VRKRERERERMSGTSDFSLFHIIQSGSEAHPAFYPVGTSTFSLGVKGAGHEVDHLLPSNAGVKDGAAIPLLLVNEAQNAFTLL